MVHNFVSTLCLRCVSCVLYLTTVSARTSLCVLRSTPNYCVCSYLAMEQCATLPTMRGYILPCILQRYMYRVVLVPIGLLRITTNTPAHIHASVRATCASQGVCSLVGLLWLNAISWIQNRTEQNISQRQPLYVHPSYCPLRMRI